MSKWTEFLTKFYQEKKKTNPEYSLKQAMKEAAKAYKKSKTAKVSSKSEEECVKACMTKGGKKNKSRKAKKGGATEPVPAEVTVSTDSQPAAV
jgi:hypothetical protein